MIKENKINKIRTCGMNGCPNKATKCFSGRFVCAFHFQFLKKSKGGKKSC